MRPTGWRSAGSTAAGVARIGVRWGPGITEAPGWPLLYLAAMRLAVYCAILLPAAHAQPVDWSTVTPAVGATVPLTDAFGPEWAPGAGAAVRLELPAYRGRVRASLAVAGYHADALPDFRTLAATLGWGPEVRLGPVRAALGVEVGAMLFRFDRVGDGAFENVTETEAAVGVWGRLEAPLTRRVQAWAGAEVLRVALAEPATVATASAGLGVRLVTPRWLRAALR